MNKKAVLKNNHVIVALTVIIIFCFVVGSYRKIPFDWSVYLYPFVLGTLTPDIIDSTQKPLHRSIMGHGKLLLKCLVFGVIPITVYLAVTTSLYSEITSSMAYMCIAIFSMGFVLHLIVDSFSKIGLV